MSRLYLLYAATIFLSSFLLFQVQPLIGKHILPWFGGSPAVWITALFFFMVGLAVGYVYALALTWFSRTLQVLVHAGVSTVVGLAIYQNSQAWRSAITPSVEQFSMSGDPAWTVFWILAVSVGLPFMLLSSTSSLLQFWYGRTTDREPFSLYAISNAGSLLGLLSYPFLFERLFPTYTQGYWWTVGFGLYAVLLAIVMVQYLRRSDTVAPTVRTATSTSPTARQFVVWMLLASVPIMAMVTGTDYITGYVAAVPFLWVIPLALYLLSFVVSFRGGPRLPRSYTYICALLATLVAIAVINNPVIPVIPTLVLVFAAMFAVNHLCHEILYESRPDKEHLNAFYVALSFGGILASSVVLLASLYIIPLPVEFLFILVATGVVAGFLLLIKAPTFLQQIHTFAPQVVWVAMAGLLVGIGGAIQNHTSGVIAIERNFFGYKAVVESTHSTGGERRTLIHGVTNHGYQFEDPALAHEPVGYYSDTSGLGAAFDYLRSEQPEGLRVAVAGLGAGALAARCQDTDSFVFYEIDPQVIALADEYFTYLDACANQEIVLADARIALFDAAAEADAPQFDFIILDAYADDVMPIHLMTTEAIAEYLDLLAPDGLLAIHISSRYLHLPPVIQALAEDNDLHVRQRLDFDHSDVDVSSHWTVLAREDVFDHEALTHLDPIEEDRPRLWTDVHSSLFPLIRWW